MRLGAESRPARLIDDDRATPHHRPRLPTQTPRRWDSPCKSQPCIDIHSAPPPRVERGEPIWLAALHSLLDPDKSVRYSCSTMTAVP
jgi:hypothetical protein